VWAWRRFGNFCEEHEKFSKVYFKQLRRSFAAAVLLETNVTVQASKRRRTEQIMENLKRSNAFHFVHLISG